MRSRCKRKQTGGRRKPAGWKASWQKRGDEADKRGRVWGIGWKEVNRRGLQMEREDEASKTWLQIGEG